MMAPLIGPDRFDTWWLGTAFYGLLLCPQRSAKLPQAQQALNPETRWDEHVRSLALIQAGDRAGAAAQVRELPRQSPHQARKICGVAFSDHAPANRPRGRGEGGPAADCACEAGPRLTGQARGWMT